ncbi:LysM peptidoglycan-binding domain-containing protein [Liquorilactobacillus vini]|uniref:LysM domain-containing protein n=2 Tax=Liquorilactobacillus vini TaxID=238015 RepID=A0A0R2CM21_9LACO|nr:LysM peptidoglycan-binding domain-containing protein [Liquorilactobacillus vini]KRM89609.1 hypothetical protein FD21_GL001117 [Liquorilactobacillus vini DSM 20605]
MSRRKKNGILKKTITWMVGIFIISFLIILGLKSSTVQSRIHSFFGDNRSAQKSEYQRQRKLAQQKYGSATDTEKKTVSSSSSKHAGSKTTTSSVDNSVAGSTKDSKRSSDSYYSSTSSSNGSTSSYRRVVVESGDTLSSLASRYGTTTSAIIRANDLSSNSISAGTTLKIPSSSTSSSSR